jgi:endonuclease YncB( thermonuclease family)
MPVADMLILLALQATLSCVPAAVTDADTLRCEDGTRIRIAGINAREKDGSCIRNAPCPPMRHGQAKPVVERLVLGKTLRCQQVGMSYRRVVASCRLPDGRDLACSIVRTGAADWWPAYVRRYRLGRCGNG